MDGRENQAEIACLKQHCDKLQEENAKLSMMLVDAEEHIRMMKQDLARLSAIKGTVEVIFGRKFND